MDSIKAEKGKTSSNAFCHADGVLASCKIDLFK